MARPREDHKVTCHCPECNGAKVTQSVWLRHNGGVSGKPSWMAEDLAVLKQIWGRGRRLADYLKQQEG